MSYQEKNITASLGSAILILGYYLISIIRMIQTGGFGPEKVFRLWGVVIVATILLNIFGTILTHIISAIVQAIQTNDPDPEIEDVEDERDELIKLKGTRVAHGVTAIGVFFAMLTFVLGHQPLVMFSFLIFSGLIAEIIADIVRLTYYRRGV